MLANDFQTSFFKWSLFAELKFSKLFLNRGKQENMTNRNLHCVNWKSGVALIFRVWIEPFSVSYLFIMNKWNVRFSFHRPERNIYRTSYFKQKLMTLIGHMWPLTSEDIKLFGSPMKCVLSQIPVVLSNVQSYLHGRVAFIHVPNPSTT